MVFNFKVKRCKFYHPTLLHCTELSCFQITQGIIISEDSTFVPEQIRPELISYCPFKGQQLQLPCVVVRQVPLQAPQAPTTKGNRSPLSIQFLRQYDTKSSMTYSDLKNKICVTQDRGTDQTLTNNSGPFPLSPLWSQLGLCPRRLWRLYDQGTWSHVGKSGIFLTSISGGVPVS